MATDARDGLDGTSTVDGDFESEEIMGDGMRNGQPRAFAGNVGEDDFHTLALQPEFAIHFNGLNHHGVVDAFRATLLEVSW